MREFSTKQVKKYVDLKIKKRVRIWVTEFDRTQLLGKMGLKV